MATRKQQLIAKMNSAKRWERLCACNYRAAAKWHKKAQLLVKQLERKMKNAV